MKIIHYINITLYSTCVILIIIGLLDKKYGFNIIISHLILGFGQPLLNLLILCNINDIDKSVMKYSHCYWVFIIVFFLLVLIFSILRLENSPLGYILMILPFLIATYFTYTTYKIQKS